MCFAIMNLRLYGVILSVKRRISVPIDQILRLTLRMTLLDMFVHQQLPDAFELYLS